MGLFGVALLLFFSAGRCQAAAEGLPFEVGEKITYQLKWGVIPAGQVVLEVLPPTTIDKQLARHFRMRVRTNRFLDTFYKVRQTVEGFTDMALHSSLYYRKKEQEGPSKRDIAVYFDLEKQTARYYKLDQKRGRAPIAIPPGTFDPFSVLYYCRLLDFSQLSQVERPITDGKKSVLGQLKNRGQQTLSLGGRSYETFLLEPDIKEVSGVFKKSPDAHILIWISADERRIPVKLSSKVIVGSFTAEMISYQAQ